MGGSGSGNFHNHPIARTTVEACYTIDANRWTREGILKAGVRCAGYCPWKLRSGGTFRVDFDARCEDTRSPTVRLWYSWTWNGGKDVQSEDYAVRLSASRPNYGGLRWWFHCPLVVRGIPCGRRVAKLHLPPRGRWFGCRHCLGLTYRSCQESHKDDMVWRMLGRMMGNDPAAIRDAYRERYG